MLLVSGKIQSSHSIISSSCFVRVALGLLLAAVGVSAAPLPNALSPGSISPLSAFGVLGVQAPVRSKIEQELDKKESNDKATRPTKGQTTPRAGHTRSGSPRTTQPVEFPVTFISDVPGAEIALDGNLIGRIKEDRRLTVKVKQGHYKATASLKGYNSQSLPVAIFGKVIYTLTLGKPIPAPTPAPTPLANDPSTEPVAAPQPPPPSADEIIKRFIDPRETDKVTVEEWREVVAQSEEITKSEPTSGQAAARLHLGKGQLAYLNKNYAESVSEFNRAISALPLSGVAHYGLGNAYLATNQPIEATKAYQRAIELTPEVAALAHKGLGDALTKLHKPKDANAYYKRALGLGYISPDINRGIAVNLMDQKQWQKALSELEAIEGSDTSAERYLYLGECYENLKRPLNAYQAYLKATQMDPNSVVAFEKLGDVLFLQRDFPAAKDAYERALALDTTGTKINRQRVRKRADTAASHARK